MKQETKLIVKEHIRLEVAKLQPLATVGAVKEPSWLPSSQRINSTKIKKKLKYYEDRRKKI